jgi:outer membrane protein OmpA-like peptidoglycan-associated protein
MKRLGNWIGAFVSLALVLSCASGSSLSLAARQVDLMDRPAPGNPRKVGPIEATSGSGCQGGGASGTQEQAVAALREKAASLGANYVQLVSVGPSSDPKRCNEVVARGIAFDTREVGLTIAGGDSPPSTPAPSAAPPATQSAKLPPPVGQPPYALGFDKPVDGCLRGHAYLQAAGTTGLPDDYSDRAPSSEIYGCEWQLDKQELTRSLPGAEANQAYAVRYQGVFQAKTSGVFRFGLASSAAARVTIDGALLVDGGANGSASSSEQSVFLGEGGHQILIEYLAAGSALSLKLGVVVPGTSSAVPFSVRPNQPFYAAQGIDYTGPAGGSGDDWRKLVEVGTEELKLKGRIYFRTGRADLNQEDQSEEVLVALAKTLRERRNIACVEVQGHTDDRGDAAQNTVLSRERSGTVKNWLIAAGIEPHRLLARGFGGSAPIAANTSDAGRAENRRVEFLIVKPTAAGVCPRNAGDAAAPKPKVEHHAPPEQVQRACTTSSSVRRRLQSELDPWLVSHRSCQSDGDCTQSIPLDCAGKSRALGCSWVLVNQSSVEALRVHGARLDSMHNYCAELPEDALARSCGGCAARPRRCADGVCRFATE